MHNRRTILKAGLASIVGTVFASPAVNAGKPIAFIPDGGPEHIHHIDDAQLAHVSVDTGWNNRVTWTGYDGTVFVSYLEPSALLAEQHFLVYAYLDTYKMPYRIITYSNQFIANVGKDNFDDILRHERLDFENEYYVTAERVA